jgi:hypothetical protein
MPTDRQSLGKRGEEAVCKMIACPRCNRPRQFRRLPTNFECADVICKFCGYLAQVKATRLPASSTELPRRFLSAAWQPQHERIIAGIFHGLYLVSYRQNGKTLVRIDFVPPHVLKACPEVFAPRNPLSAQAKRAGWQGYYLNIDALPAVGIMQVHAAN